MLLITVLFRTSYLPIRVVIYSTPYIQPFQSYMDPSSTFLQISEWWDLVLGVSGMADGGSWDIQHVILILGTALTAPPLDESGIGSNTMETSVYPPSTA